MVNFTIFFWGLFVFEIECLSVQNNGKRMPIKCLHLVQSKGFLYPGLMNQAILKTKIKLGLEMFFKMLMSGCDHNTDRIDF